MQPIDPQANGPQLLYGLRYHVHVNTEEEAITFHDQVGYWLWEPATGLVMQTLAIPRGQSLLAGGKAKPDGAGLNVSARRGETERFTAAPRHAPRRRLDETKAAREPKLRWTPPEGRKEAAE